MATTEGTTVIGESILISGSLAGDEDLTVRGRVEGTLTLTRTLVVEPTGTVKAEVQVKNCVISGVVVGNVTATESVEITKEGRMVGDIAAPRVIIVEGAAFRGHVDMGAAGEIKPGERPARPQVAPVAVRPAALVRPTLPPRPPPPAPKGAESKPPPPPPLPPALKPSVSAPMPSQAPVAMAMGKKKVVVKRKK